MTYRPLRRYFRGQTLTSMVDVQAGTRSQYHFDHQGTTQCLTNSTGAVTDRFAADAWGVPVKREGSSINRHWYVGNGGYYRGNILQDYIRQRNLSVSTAGWLTKDPLPSFNRFSYASNSPAIRSDPSGLWDCYVKSTRFLENTHHCLPFRSSWGANSVLVTHLTRFCAEIVCREDIHSCSKSPCPKLDWTWCQSYHGYFHMGHPPRGWTPINVPASSPCPDNRKNLNAASKHPIGLRSNCDRSSWEYEGQKQNPELVRNFASGRLRVCEYVTCASDTPGIRDRDAPFSCYLPIEAHRIRRQNVRGDWLPMNIDLTFQSWICSNTATGELAPGAGKLSWRFLVTEGGSERQKCGR